MRHQLTALRGTDEKTSRRFSGLARELREQPELLSSAYLLRGSPTGDAAGPLAGGASGSLPSGPGPEPIR